MNKRYYYGVAALALLTVVGCRLAYVYATSPDHLEYVIDGDTLVVNGRQHVRLWGIDAPEMEQLCTRDNGGLKIGWHCGKVAREYLKSMLALKVDLRCEQRGKDGYGRTVSICYTVNPAGQRHDIARSLVAAGWAVDYPRYSHGYYASEQAYAQGHKLGVWSGVFEMPWDWRQAKR